MVYVVILNWNGAADTIECLTSLSKLAGEAPKILVCDNASTDNSWAMLANYIENQTKLDIQLIQTGANLGFAGGNNIGLRLALSDPEMQFVWLLNNDTEVDPEALSSLMRYMNVHANVGICGSTLLYMHDPTLIQAVGGQYNFWLGTSRHVLCNQKYSEDLCKTVDSATLDYIVGASMFVRRAVLEGIGLLAEDYFLYCEEIDWTTRMRLKAPEYKLGYCAESIVYHREGASTGAKERAGKNYRYFSDYFFITSRLRCVRRFYPLRKYMVQATMFLVTLNRIRRGQLKSAFVAICCFVGFIPSFMDPRKVSKQ